MTIAESLVLRKHLQNKVEQLKPIYEAGERGMFELKVDRVPVSSGQDEKVDELRMKVPRVTMADVTQEYDKYAKALRVLDTKIQEANWKYKVDFDESVYLPETKKTK
jgi:hypothetical protein